ncbi:unnamed protein product [Nippostrongylus brasiliensis]|uniref:PMD domain-containing protein n=1 Tax=Nippostrongylus brasiliensis TaxID=27835 RepID=A0A0N4XD22_NIPBR|nr:unnamed protein product [Nippostrongylus brasiliensis]
MHAERVVATAQVSGHKAPSWRFAEHYSKSIHMDGIEYWCNGLLTFLPERVGEVDAWDYPSYPSLTTLFTSKAAAKPVLRPIVFAGFKPLDVDGLNTEQLRKLRQRLHHQKFLRNLLTRTARSSGQWAYTKPIDYAWFLKVEPVDLFRFIAWALIIVHIEDTNFFVTQGKYRIHGKKNTCYESSTQGTSNATPSLIVRTSVQSSLPLPSDTTPQSEVSSAREVYTIPKTPSDKEKPQTARQKDDNHKDSIRDLKDQLREAQAQAELPRKSA